MNFNTKLEVAVEILAAKIALSFFEGYKADSEKMVNLSAEREEMYKGNEIVIEKIIRDYGPEVKKEYEIV